MTNEFRKAKLKVREAIQAIVDFLFESAKKANDKAADIEKRKRNAHFPAIMRHCKECRVCLKQYMGDKNAGKKSRRKRLKEEEQKGQGFSAKIKKTKYCC